MSRTIRLEVEGTPPSLNRFVGRQNTWEYRRYKALWDKTIEVAGRKIAPPAPLSHALVHLHFIFPDRRKRDAGNCEKFITDGLTRAGIIADDNVHCIRLVLDGEYQKGVSRTIVEVTELEMDTGIDRDAGGRNADRRHNRRTETKVTTQNEKETRQ